ncbi:plasma membrane calcium [Blastocladiella emersonii ATCC 22665]|nr:plasma membrane calcium [Blastocladiella emersonii ATCC 22665]
MTSALRQSTHELLTGGLARRGSGGSDTPAASHAPFAVSPSALSGLIEHKDRAAYDALGGTSGIAAALRVDPARGLCPPADYVPPSTAWNKRQAANARKYPWSSSASPAPSPSTEALSPSGSSPAGRSSRSTGGARSKDPDDVNDRPLLGRAESVGASNDGLALRDMPTTVVVDADGAPVAADDGSTAEVMKARLGVYGENRLPEVASKTIFQLMWAALQDKTLIFLTCAALVSLGIGIYEDYGMEHPPDKDGHAPEKIKWVEGVAIIVAVVIVVLVGSVNDWQKERQFRALSKKVDDRVVKVLRNGNTTLISVYDLLVGDVLCLEPGDVLPADAVFITGHGVRCDESAATGESDAIKKGFEHDVFLISGSKVQEGTGHCLVIAVGPNSFHGRTMMSMRTEDSETPLQEKLNGLAEDIAKLGGAAALTMLIVLLIKYFATTAINGGFADGPNKQSAPQIVEAITQIFITTITVLVVAVPEGLPLAVTLSLAFATKKMLQDNNLVRVLASCEVMGNATTVCSDKTGTLTQNRMTVVRAHIGHPEHDVGGGWTSKAATVTSSPSSPSSPKSMHGQTDMAHPDDAARLKVLIGDDQTMWELLQENIALNSSAFEDLDSKSGQKVFIGSKTETALLDMQRRAGVDYAAYRAAAQTVHVYPFSSANKWMGTIVKHAAANDNGDHVRLHVKGASEIVLAHCASVYIRGKGPQPLTPHRVQQLTALIDAYAQDSLRTIAIAYLDAPRSSLPDDLVTTLPLTSSGNGGGELSMNVSTELNSELGASLSNFPSDPRLNAAGAAAAPAAPAFQATSLPGASSVDKAKYTAAWSGNMHGAGLVLLGIVGIEDPVRPGVPEAVEQCQRAGVFVRMVTGDNVATARAIASKCGIYNRGGIVMEGRAFRRLSQESMDKIIPRLQVLARSSPTDKQLLVERLQALGEVVAVTGDGTNDGPALKMADVGFSMGIAGTEVAKEASSIILMDDNFASIVKAILWGRSVNDSVRKFLQFQLTVNVTAVVVTFVSAVASSTQRSVLTAVQLLWVNLIMDSLAALALATEPPTAEMLERHPDSKTAPLISYSMWKMVLGQASFQIVINLLALFIGPQIFGADTDKLNTLVFNAFIFLQIFNEINCRRLDNHLNVFKGIHRNPYFVTIMLLTILLQVVIVQFGRSAFQTVPLNAGEWLACIAIGFLSIPVGIIIRLLPDWFYTPPADERVFMTKERLQWIGAISSVQTQLRVFHALRGSRRLGTGAGPLSPAIRASQNTLGGSAGGAAAAGPARSPASVVGSNPTLSPLGALKVDAKSSRASLSPTSAAAAVPVHHATSGTLHGSTSSVALPAPGSSGGGGAPTATKGGYQSLD